MKKIYLVLFVILSVFVFSCKDNLISDDLSSNQNSGVGQVKVFVKQSRLIGPELSDVSWDVKLLKDNENDTISGKNENGYYLFSGLSDGTYNITVSGKINEVEKFTGSAKVTITNGNSVSVNVPIVATKNPNAEVQSTGYATITMDMSGKLLSLLNSMGSNAYFEAYLSTDLNEHGNVTASLVKITYDDQRNSFIEFLDNQKVEFVDNIPTGYYYLTFSGLERYGYTIKLKDNLVEIGDGLTTNIVLTENDYELVEELSESQIFYVDNSDNNHVYDTNNTTYAGLSLSNPLGFRNINENTSYGNILYLISDVNTYVNAESSISYISVSTITSFGSNIFNIINNNKNFSLKFEGTFLKNIKLTNTTGAGFILLQCPIDGKVILDTPIVQDSNTDSTVLMSKSSNLVIGQNFSGELGIRLSPENWQLGDTVVTFENGVKPSNSNFYISENDDMPTGFASMFYIDDNGKLAQYDATSQWVNFAWDDECPCLITQTQAKNKTYTRIIDNDGYSLSDFNGISTYDENGTWYFIGKKTENNQEVYCLFSVSPSENYENSVYANLVYTPSLDPELTMDSVQAMSYDDGKLYFGFYDSDIVNLYVFDNDTCSSIPVNISHISTDGLTALLVDGDNVYMATKNPSSDDRGVTHSAIWQLKLEQTENGYVLNPAQTSTDDTGATNPVPYYQTLSDIFEGEIEGSTFRITDLYSDGNSVYGLLANYIEKEGVLSVGSNDKNKSFMRGSVFKLEQNTSRQKNSSVPIMNATHLGLRKSFPLTSDNLATAKKYFILPRKIVGILNKKLVIVDDGMVPDVNEPNVDRFVLFDLADEISETIDVAVPFSTNGVATTSSPRTFYTINSLFN